MKQKRGEGKKPLDNMKYTKIKRMRFFLSHWSIPVNFLPSQVPLNTTQIVGFVGAWAYQSRCHEQRLKSSEARSAAALPIKIYYT